MEFLKGFLAFLLGFAFLFFYYRNLWIWSKIQSKKLKLSVKYGRGSQKLEKFRQKFGGHLYSRPFRFLLFITFTFVVFQTLGIAGLIGFSFALIGANLLLFPWGWKQKNPNGGDS